MNSTPADMMRHALGANRSIGHVGGDRWKKPYRNRYVTSSGNDAAWCELLAQGFARRLEGSENSWGGHTYAVTDAGRAHALAGLTFKRVWGYGEPTNP